MSLISHLADREKDLFDLPERICLFELTNSYFEGDAADNPKARTGHSKEKRSDCKLLTLALVVDELGYLTYGPDAANLLFQVVDRRYLARRPMIVTSNKDPGTWGDVLHDNDLAEAIVDRLLERGDVIRLRGKSYRNPGADDQQGAA